jgi:hypothetical protein
MWVRLTAARSKPLTPEQRRGCFAPSRLLQIGPMDRWITGAKLFMLAMFLITSLGVAAYDIFYVWPATRCGESGAWWDPKDRQCLTPIPIWRFTGRGLVTGPAQAAGAQRPAAGTHKTSPPSLAAANRAATNSKSDSRLR